MVSPHWYFVINPVSGNGEGVKVWKQIQGMLDAENWHYSFGISEFHKHSIQLVTEKYKEGIRHFIGIGGDGTLNEMVNAIMNSPQGEAQSPCVIGLLSVGTGNDWVKSQTEKLTVENLIAKLKTEQSIFHNVGAVNVGETKNPFYFMNIAGAGIDGFVVNELEKSSESGKPGKLVYLQSLLKALFRFKAPSTKVTIDEEPSYSGQALLMAASIGAYFGDGMHLSPNANAQDKSLDFTIVRKDNLFSIFTQLHKLFNGKIASATFVEKASGRELSFKAKSPLCVQADGELVGESNVVSFSFVHNAIKVLA